jgi:hypothetical protein
MKTYWGVGVQIHVFLISVLVGGEWSVSRPCRFTPEERALRMHWVESWVDSRAGLDEVEKGKFLTLLGLELRPLRRYTDYRGSYHEWLSSETEQGMKSILQEAEQQLECYGFVKRMEDSRTDKQITEWDPQRRKVSAREEPI